MGRGNSNESLACIFVTQSGGCFDLFILGRHVPFWGWTPLWSHPPLKPPFQCSHPDKKGTNLLLFKICIHLHTHQDLKLKCRVLGQKLIRTSMHTWPTRHPQPACTAPQYFHSFKITLTVSCRHGPGGLEWIAAPVAWLTRTAFERSCLWIFDMSTDFPLLPNLLKKGGNHLGLSWGFR